MNRGEFDDNIVARIDFVNPAAPLNATDVNNVRAQLLLILLLYLAVRARCY